jgi:hypothetical protein
MRELGFSISLSILLCAGAFSASGERFDFIESRTKKRKLLKTYSLTVPIH